jgi:hypothetical protein
LLDSSRRILWADGHAQGCDKGSYYDSAGNALPDG